MASAIDPTLPVQGNPTTASVRANFSAAKSEIEALQATAGVGPQGPIGPTGPSGTIAVGTVTTGAAGTSVAVTNTGSNTAATFNFTIPRGDSGTGGSGITETQAKDAVRQGNVNFLESPATEAVTFPTTPNLAGIPTMGANWTGAATPTATSTYTHAISSAEPLSYPASIANGAIYQVIFSMTNVPATSTVLTNFFAIFFRTAPTTTTGQQSVLANISTAADTNNANATITIAATGNFSWVSVVPSSGWQGTFIMTRVTEYSGAQNSATFSIKDWIVRARGTSLYEGAGGLLATGTGNIALGSNALSLLTASNGNIAIGTNTLSRASSGGNVAIGSDTLGLNLGGSNNTGVGNQALYNNQTGYNNVAVGNNALYNNRAGYGNTAVGGGGVLYNASGSSTRNTALGYYAMYQVNETAMFNTALGEWAMGQFVGSNNTGVGCRALSPSVEGPTQVSGSNITAVGYKAGAHIPPGGALTTLENSVFVGANTKGHANGETNQIVIGYNAEGHGSNTITLGNDGITALHCHVQTISALSDSRVKENIQHADLNKCLTAVKNLPVSEWDWLPIAGPHPDKHDIGFVSDDVAKVFPKAITKEDRFLTLRDAQGNPEMTTVTETNAPWTPPPDAGPVPASTQTRQVEKTMEIKGLQYVSTAEMLPTLWGAVQQLIQRIEQLEKPADNPGGASGNPSTESKGGFFRGKKQ